MGGRRTYRGRINYQSKTLMTKEQYISLFDDKQKIELANEYLGMIFDYQLKEISEKAAARCCHRRQFIK